MKFTKIAALALGFFNLAMNAYVDSKKDYNLSMAIDRIDLPEGSYRGQGANGCSFSFYPGDGVLVCTDNYGGIMKLAVVRYNSSYGRDYEVCSGDITVGQDTSGNPALKCENDKYISYRK